MTRHTSVRVEDGVVYVHITEEGLSDGATTKQLSEITTQVKAIRSQVQRVTNREG